MHLEPLRYAARVSLFTQEFQGRCSCSKTLIGVLVYLHPFADTFTANGDAIIGWESVRQCLLALK